MLPIHPQVSGTPKPLLMGSCPRKRELEKKTTTNLRCKRGKEQNHGKRIIQITQRIRERRVSLLDDMIKSKFWL
jgi:hypothetical protein